MNILSAFDGFLTNHKPLKIFFLVIGLIWVGSKTIKFSYQLLSFILKRHRNLIQRYGENSYAIITGASDGIGKSFCLQLAKRGFNICLIARNKQKLEKVVEEIQAINPKVATRIVIADFVKSTEEGFFEKIENEIKDLDISMLINNVGIDCFEPYEELTLEEIRNLIVINCLPMTMLMKKIIPYMLARKTRSAIINVSSMAGTIPMPYYNVYSASKAFNDFLSRSLAIEFPNIDILSLRPSDVSTQMTFNRPIDFFTISAKDCVEGCLSDIGHQATTYGSWKHKLQGHLYELIPFGIFSWGFKKFYAPEIFAERQKCKKAL